MELLQAGFDLDTLRRLADSGFTGHDVYWWRKCGVPASEWIESRDRGIDHQDARGLYSAGATKPALARQWMETRLSMDSVRDYISRGISPKEAMKLVRSGAEPEDLMPVLPGLEDLPHEPTLNWTEVFGRPRSSAPVFAVHSDVPEALAERLRRALDDLGSYGATIGTMFDTYYHGLAFLDGVGWAKRVPYGLNGPSREWIVGVDAMALLCHRLRVELPRTGRFRSAPSDEELEARWETQRRDETDLQRRSGMLAEAGYRPRLEEVALELRSPDPIPGPRPLLRSESHPLRPIPRGISRKTWHSTQSHS